MAGSRNQTSVWYEQATETSDDVFDDNVNANKSRTITIVI